jgi:ribosomal protein L7Ae-like RNA K-turn-binding protein
LQTTYPEQRGFSSRIIKRFCREKEIKRWWIVSNKQLNDAVGVAVSEVVVGINIIYKSSW